MSTKIQWTEDTWNPIVGCSVVSPGCTNCYAMRRTAPRLSKNPATPHYHGTVQPSKGGYVWTGKISIAGDTAFLKPLRIRKPTMFFVNSMSDLFHENVPDEVIDRIFAIMALCPQHTFQVLTKRSARMREYVSNPGTSRGVYEIVCDMVVEDSLPAVLRLDGIDDPGIKPSWPRIHLQQWPLPNVWLGVSVEDQKRADERIPDLLDTPAAIRFISAEPLLGPVDLTSIPAYPSCDLRCGKRPVLGMTPYQFMALQEGRLAVVPTYNVLNEPHLKKLNINLSFLNWVIVGGESGKGARPMHPHWARQIRDQCASAGVPFFFKQWGDHLGGTGEDDGDRVWFKAASKPIQSRHLAGADRFDWFDPDIAPDGPMWLRLGTKVAGRALDGIEHNAMPDPRP